MVNSRKIQEGDISLAISMINGGAGRTLQQNISSSILKNVKMCFAVCF